MKMKRNRRIAKYWDEIQATTLDYMPRVRELHRYFEQNGVKTVLDVACGTGTFLLHLSRLGYECTGIDADEDMLASAKEKAGREKLNVEFLRGDMKNIKLEKQFHAVTCFQAFSFLSSDEDVERTLAGIRNTLVPGGLFIFEILSRDMDGVSPAAEIGRAHV
jgi:2-polyprenyl-3-methyl-5-hydroxy-6-metoxy-1,4-benzoquinol methylase